jgi:translocation and assembly module TamB
MTHRARTVVRWSARIVLGLVALVLLLGGLALLALHTEPGRGWLRGRIERALDDAFAGEVRVGRVEGSVLGTLVVRDVVIEDPAGAPAITVGVVRANLAYGPLTRREIHVERVLARGVVVRGTQDRDGRLSLAGLLAKREKKPLPWAVHVASLEIADGRVEIIRPAGQELHVDGIAVTGSLRVDAGGQRVRAHVAAAGAWRERGAPMSIVADVDKDGEVLGVDRVELALGGVTVGAHDVRVVGNQAAGELTVDAPAKAVAQLVPASPLEGDVHLALRARHAQRGGGTAVALDGTVGDAVLDGELTVWPREQRLAGDVRVRDLDAAAIWRGGTVTALTARVELDVTSAPARTGIASLDGRVRLSGSGAVAGAPLEALTVDARLADGRATVRLDARGAGGARVHADAALEIRPGEPLRVDRAELAARADDLGAATGARADWRGRVTLSLALSGPIEPGGSGVAARGSLRGEGIGVGASSVETVELDFDFRGLPRQARGWLRGDARGIVQQGRPVGAVAVRADTRPDGAIAVVARSRPPMAPLQIDLDAVIRPGEVVVVELGRHRFETRGVAWHGRGGRIAFHPGRVEARGLNTTIAGGAVRAEGTLFTGGARRGDVDARVDVDRVDLEEIDRSLDLGGETLALRGLVDVRADVRARRGRWAGSVEGSARGVAVRANVPGVDADLRGTLRAGQLDLEANARAEGVGAFYLHAQIDAPARVTDPRAWQRLARRHLRHGKVKIDGLDLAAVARLAGTPPTATGTIDGQLAMSSSETEGWLRATGIEHPSLPAALDAELRLDRVDVGVVHVSLAATLRGLARASGDATLRVPTRPLDLRAWLALDQGAVQRATLTVADVVVNRRLARHLRLRGSDWGGRASARIELGAALRTATATAEVRGLRGGPFARPVDGSAEIRLDARGVSATLRGLVDGREAVRAEARTPLTVARLVEGGATALRAAPITLALRAERVPLSALRAPEPATDVFAGELDADLEVRGTLASPALRGTVVIDEGGRQRLRVDVAVDRADLDAARVTVKASELQLRPLSRLAPNRLIGISGVLDGQVALVGARPDRASVTGALAIRDAHLPLGPTVGTLREGSVILGAQGGVANLAVVGKVGAGTARLRARAELAGLVPRSADAQLVIDDVSPISAIQPRIDATVEARLRRENGVWRLAVLVRDATVVVPADRGTTLFEPGAPDDMVFIYDGRPPPARAEPGARRLRLGERPARPELVAEIEVRKLSLRAEEGRAQASGTITATMGQGALAIDGAIEVGRGEVVLFQRRYRLERATVRFDGGVDPVLDVLLVHEFSEVTLYAALRGRLSRPSLALRSDPATYTEGQLLSFLLGGEPGTAPGGETQAAATGIASSLLSRRISGYIDEILPVGLDVLRYEAATTQSAASLTLGKWLTEKLFLAYRRRLEARPDANSGEAQLEYWLRRDLMLQVVVGDRGYHGADLLWRKRW